MDSALFVNYHGIVVTLRREELSWLPVFRIGENYRDGDTLPGESQTVRPGEPHSEIQRPGASAQPVPAGDALCGGRSGPGERHAGSSARHLRGLQRVSVLHRQYGVRRRNPPQLQGRRRASRPDSLHRPRATKNPAHPPLRRAVRRRATVQPRRMALVYRDGTDRHRPVGRVRRLSRLPVRHRCRVPGEREPQSALRTGPAGPDARDGHRRKGQCAHRIGRTGQRLFAVRQLYRRHGRCRRGDSCGRQGDHGLLPGHLLPGSARTRQPLPDRQRQDALRGARTADDGRRSRRPRDADAEAQRAAALQRLVGDPGAAGRPGFGRNLLPVAALRTVAARRRSFLPGVRREPFLAAGDRACALPDRARAARRPSWNASTPMRG